jgi:hypothetical protein
VEFWSIGVMESWSVVPFGVGLLSFLLIPARSRSFLLVRMIQVNQAELFQLATHVIDIETQFTGSEAGPDFRFSFFTLLPIPTRIVRQ